MDKESARLIRELQRQVADLSRRADQRPVLSTGKGGGDYKFVSIVGGNTLETGQDGVVYVEDPGVETVPSAYDPDVTSSFVDGIGRGTLFINGVAQTGYVLVVNDGRGSFRNSLVISDVVWVGDPVSIPVDGGGSISTYPAG
jgi:hypothetical protein